jgi:hypothetical protein
LRAAFAGRLIEVAFDLRLARGVAPQIEDHGDGRVREKGRKRHRQI